MNIRARAVAVLGFLVASGAAPEHVPAQKFGVVDDEFVIMSSGRLQKWENELLGTDCVGECPDGSQNCCTVREMPT